MRRWGTLGAVVAHRGIRRSAARGRRRTISALWSAVAAVAALLTLSTGVAQAASGGDSNRPIAAERAGGSASVLPVWALLDGDTPVFDGRVRVYELGRAGTAGRLLRQRNGASSDRTNDDGTALLDFGRLPRDFIVTVSGGRANGRALPGALRTEVRRYRSSAAAVVFANPVTTLASAFRRDDSLTVAGATRAAYRRLAVPRYEDGFDLQNSDQYLDGDAYLALARRRGGIGRLSSELVDRKAPQRFPGGGSTARSAADIDWLRLASADDLSPFFSQLLKTGGGLAASGIGGFLAEAAGKAALGWVLAAFGYEDLLKNQDMELIKQALGELNKKVTRLESQVETAGFSTLVHLTDVQTGKISHAAAQLALLTSMTDRDPTRKKFAETVSAYVGANLVDVPAILNQNLGTSVPIADNLLKGASRIVQKQGRFFDAKSSGQIRRIYDYYAAQQIQASLLIVEYQHTLPEAFSGATVKAGIDRVAANIDAQKQSLKPAVPVGTVIDTRTNRMWTQDYPNDPVHRATEFLTLRTPAKGGRETAQALMRGPMSLGAKYVFNNWTLPFLSDYKALVDGWTGKDPAEWLIEQAHMPRGVVLANEGRQFYGNENTSFLRDLNERGFDYRRGSLWNDIVVNKFDLRCGCKRGQESTSWFFKGRWVDGLRDMKGGVLYSRPVPAGEAYWW